MSKVKKSFTPKKKKTLVPEPNWAKIRAAVSEEDRERAFQECDDYIHYEMTDHEQIHHFKKWIREQPWPEVENLSSIPDVYLSSLAKFGAKAIYCRFMPLKAYATIEATIRPLLAKAEELRLKMNYEPPIYPTLLQLDNDDPLHPDKVKEWIAHWRAWLKDNKHKEESNDRQDRSEYRIAVNYVYNLNNYIRHGVYSDNRYGKDREGKIKYRCYAMAYDKDGVVKRNFDTWYPDVGMWTKEKAEGLCDWMD